MYSGHNLLVHHPETGNKAPLILIVSLVCECSSSNEKIKVNPNDKGNNTVLM